MKLWIFYFLSLIYISIQQAFLVLPDVHSNCMAKLCGHERHCSGRRIADDETNDVDYDGFAAICYFNRVGVLLSPADIIPFFVPCEMFFQSANWNLSFELFFIAFVRSINRARVWKTGISIQVCFGHAITYINTSTFFSDTLNSTLSIFIFGGIARTCEKRNFYATWHRWSVLSSRLFIKLF